MARTAINLVSNTAAGYNLTDSADFTVMATGANNGVTFPYAGADILVLKNTTGGAAVYTIKAPAPAGYDRVTVSDETVTVAAGKTWFYPLTRIFVQSDAKVYVDCDVAGSILVLQNAT